MKKKDALIIGGGIIGLCTARYLTEMDYEVTIVDQSDFTNGTSFGNAGMVVPSHFIPMAAPGVINKGLKWMLDPLSPFYVKPRPSAALVSWIFRFSRSATPAKVNAAMPVLAEFNTWSKALYKEMAEIHNLKFGFQEKGLLMLYKTQKQEKEEIETAEFAHALGMKAEILDQSALKNIEPDMELDVRGGLLFSGDAHLNPNHLMNALKSDLEAKGTHFVANHSISSFDSVAGSVSRVNFTNGHSLQPSQVIITAGAWSSHILKKLNFRLLLQDGKGYSFTLSDLNVIPQIPTILSEDKVAITPLGSELRIGGTLELSGLNAQINQNRVKGIHQSIARYYKNLDVQLPEMNKVWTGYRPCTPDGLPYIGKIFGLENVFVGTGHGMMGISMGAATGKLLAEIVAGQKPSIETLLFNPNRF